MFEHLDDLVGIDSLTTRQGEVKADLTELDSAFAGRNMDKETQDRFDALAAEDDEISRRIKALEDRAAVIQRHAGAGNTVPGDGNAVTRYDPPAVIRRKSPEDVYDLYAYRRDASSEDEEAQALHDGAMRSVEMSEFPTARAKEDAQTSIEILLKNVRGPEGWTRNQVEASVTRRILATGSAPYHRAFWKSLQAQVAGVPAPLTAEESRALSVGTGSAGGFAVVYQLDPTMIPTSNYSVNPFRAISNMQSITGTNEWKAVTSGAITAAYSAEAIEASDNTPTLAQPDIIVEKAQAYVPFSIEIGQDWGALESSMGTLFQQAKDDLEATKFVLGAGHGSQEPKGIITAATTTVAPAGGVGTFAIGDLYGMFEALPPRFRPRASWLAHLFAYDKARQFDTAGGSGVWAIDINARGQLQAGAGGTDVGAIQGRLGMLLGRNAYESSAIDNALTTGKKPLVIGDFNYFVIVDRVGMNVEVVPLVVGTNHRPTGQRGLYAYWRNSSDVLTASAFRVLAEP